MLRRSWGERDGEGRGKRERGEERRKCEDARMGREGERERGEREERRGESGRMGEGEGVIKYASTCYDDK